MTDNVKIYCDGACSNNPGPGGWGAVLLWRSIQKEISGAEINTTNNRMEITAAIESLKIIKISSKIDIYTDSIYLKNGITIWISKWLNNNWNNGKVKNVDLWLELYNLTNKHDIKWHWVKGHSGDLYNELADKLARCAIINLSNSNIK